jgi:hypothetical protein
MKRTGMKRAGTERIQTRRESRENDRNAAHRLITPGASTSKTNTQKNCTADSMARAATGRKFQGEMTRRKLIF